MRKKNVMKICVAAFALSVVAGAAAWNTTQVSAADSPVSMHASAAIRTVDPNGIRFYGQITDECYAAITDETTMGVSVSFTYGNTVATLNPKFAETQDSTIDFLRKVMCNNRENMQYNKFVTDRVYDKEDESKTPVMYVYMDYVDGKKSVYVAVHGKDEFEEMSVEEFEQKYVCYDKDLEKNKGKKPWEELEAEDKDIINL